MTGDVSIVIPVLDEQAGIVASLRRLVRDFADCEILVVDGGSTDATVALAAQVAAEAGRSGVRVLPGPQGRARQMNAGAGQAGGEVLWFVHADTRIEPAARRQIAAALADPAVVGGGLTLRFDPASPALRYLAWASNQRARRLHWIFGDQAMFVRREAFQAVGGFPDLPIMEDLEMSRRLSQLGRLVVLAAASTASSRRFDQHGTWRMLAFMQWLKALHFAGVDAEEIARRYAAGPGRRPPAGRGVRQHRPVTSPKENRDAVPH